MPLRVSHQNRLVSQLGAPTTIDTVGLVLSNYHEGVVFAHLSPPSSHGDHGVYDLKIYCIACFQKLVALRKYGFLMFLQDILPPGARH